MRADPQGTQERNSRVLLARIQRAAAGLVPRLKIARPPGANETGIGKYTALTAREEGALLARQREQQMERAKKYLTRDTKKVAASLKESKARWQAFESGRAQAQSPEGQAQYRATAAQAMAEAGRQAAAAANRERELRTALAAPPERRTRR